MLLGTVDWRVYCPNPSAAANPKYYSQIGHHPSVPCYSDQFGPGTGCLCRSVKRGKAAN